MMWSPQSSFMHWETLCETKRLGGAAAICHHEASANPDPWHVWAAKVANFETSRSLDMWDTKMSLKYKPY